MLNDMTAAPGKFAYLEWSSCALAWSCLGWPQGGACVALAALLQACLRCMHDISITAGIWLLQKGPAPVASMFGCLKEGNLEPQLRANGCMHSPVHISGPLPICP